MSDNKYYLEIKWNREFEYSPTNGEYSSIQEAIKVGNEKLYSGDGARVKSYRVIDQDHKVVFPRTQLDKSPRKDLNHRLLYTCSFCGKKELGKSKSYLINPDSNSNHSVSLRPAGWDWNIQPTSFKDLWSCGCYKFR